LWGYSFSADFFFVWGSRSGSSSAEADSDSSPEITPVSSSATDFTITGVSAGTDNAGDFVDTGFLALGDADRALFGDEDAFLSFWEVFMMVSSSEFSEMTLLFFFFGSAFVSNVFSYPR
jgi:hypothetical protein